VRHLTRLALAALALAGPPGGGLTMAAPAASTQDEEFQYTGRVVVTADGNGMAGARFPTFVGGEDVTYYLTVSNGCGTRRACAGPVKALNVTLNGEVVLQKAAFTSHRSEVALNLVGSTDNEIMVAADGEQGAEARFAIVAVRRDLP
jgi:hypothetical protein